MLLTKEVEVEIVGNNSKFYENKGYYIPRHRDKQGRIAIPKGTKIRVNVHDLPKGSHAEIEYICDYCNEEGNTTPLILPWKAYYKHKKDIINKDACNKHSTQKAKDLGTRVVQEKIVLPKEEIKKYYLELASKINDVPKIKHMRDEIKINPNFPSIKTIQNVFGTINELKKYCQLETQYFKYTKEELLNLLRDYIHNHGVPTNRTKTFNNKNGLPSYKTYVFHFRDDLVNLIQICGFDLSEDEKYQLNNGSGKATTITKEDAITIVYKMQAELDRPLMYDDFRNPSKDTIGITTIKKYWGSMNKMKEALGLEIIQENMIDKVKSKEELLNDMRLFIEELGRVPTSKEVNNNPTLLDVGTYFKYFGGINNVFLMLGHKPNKKVLSLHLTDEEIITIYKDYIEELGFTPTYGWCEKIYELPSPVTILRRFGCTWNEFITKIGFTPNLQNRKGEMCFAEDGTRCLSKAELIVHNYLLSQKINIISKEYNYRDLTDDSNLKDLIGYKRCDWLLQHDNNFYIVEYFGLMGEYNYDKRHDLKLRFIKESNLQDNFIALYPKDLNHLDKVFNFMF